MHISVAKKRNLNNFSGSNVLIQTFLDSKEALFFFVGGKWAGAGLSTKYQYIFPPTRSPGSCCHLRERGLHLNGDKWDKMLLRAQLSAPHWYVSERNRPTPVQK